MNRAAVGSKSRAARMLYLDVLRVAATFSIMMIHVSAREWNGVVRAGDWMACDVYDGICRWGVPVFLMISGALFLGREIPLHRLYGKYILRIAAAFVFWTIVHTAAYVWMKHDSGHLLDKLVNGPYHLWFLFVIIGMYMIVPLLNAIVRHRRLARYFLLLSLIFAFAAPQLSAVLSLFSPRYGAFLGTVTSNLQPNLVMGLTAYFVLGYVLNAAEWSARADRAILLLGIAGFCATVLLTKAVSGAGGEPNEMFYSYRSLTVLAEAVFVFALCKKLFSRVPAGNRTGTFLAALSKYSFGAYLVHVLVLELLGAVLGMDALPLVPALGIPLKTAAVFAVSFGVSAAIHRVPVLNRYIV